MRAARWRRLALAAILAVLCVVTPAPPTRVARAAGPVIAGYAYSQSLLVTNPATTTVGGSVVSGTVPATSTDYVVQLHLTGAEAASVYANAQDKTTFTDVAVFWYNGSSYVQIDTDFDPFTNGSWGASNITLWFKLQAQITGGGTDTNYVLAWGAASPTVKRDWTHIYEMSDDFNTSAGQGTDGSGRTGWNTGQWISQPVSWTLTNGMAVVTATAGAGAVYFWTKGPYNAYGPGHVASFRTIMPNTPASESVIAGWYSADGAHPNQQSDIVDYGWLSSWAVEVVASSDATDYVGTTDANFDVYSDAISPDGTTYGWRNDGTVFHNTEPMSSTVNRVWLDANGSATSNLIAYFDYVKVRPFQPQEPTVTVVGSPLTGLPAAANPFTLAVTGAALSIASPSSALNASPIVLNGSSQSVTSTLPLTVTDARGTGAGWTLSIDAADPKTSGGKTIPFADMTLGPQPPAIVDSSGTSPLNLTTGPPGNLSGSDSSPGTTTSSPYTLLTAPALQGMGMYTQNEGITLTVPATASTGTYTTTLVIVVQ
jgi:hypothetical protein